MVMDYNELIEQIREYDHNHKVVIEEAEKLPTHWYNVDLGGGQFSRFPFFNDLETARDFEQAVEYALDFQNRMMEIATELKNEYAIPTNMFIAHYDIWYKLENTDSSDYTAFYSVRRNRKDDSQG